VPGPDGNGLPERPLTKFHSHAAKIFAVSIFIIAMCWLGGCGSPSNSLPRGPVPKSLNSAGTNYLRRTAQAVPAAQGTAVVLAPFFGNLTAVTGGSGPDDSVSLQRQADCSLLYSNFTFKLTGTDVAITVNSQTPHYEKILHENASLTTLADAFASGCVEQTLGRTSGLGVYLGTTKSGNGIGAMVNGGAVYVSTLTSGNSIPPPVALASDLMPNTLTAGDFRKDGNQDVVTVNTNGIDSSVDVFLSNGDGTFKAPAVLALPSTEASFAVVDDMNADGNLDIVVGTQTQASGFQFLIYLGKGDGTFAAPVAFTPGGQILSFFSTFIAADVNGDGAPDIITEVGQVFLGQKSGTSFTLAPQSLPEIGSATNGLAPGMVTADFNKDGKIDLATNDGRTIRTYLGLGDGRFSAGPAYATVANRGFLVALDLDGDGNVDLFSGLGNNGLYGGDDFLPGVAYALMGNGDGTFQGAPNVPVAYDGTNLGDLNGDGRPDLVNFTVNSNNQGILNAYLTQSNGIPKLGPQLVLPVGQTGGIPVLGAFKGGTTLDAFWVGTTPIGLTFNLAAGNGDGSFQLPTTVNAPSLVPAGDIDVQQDINGVQVADINHDGKADLIYSFFDVDATTNTYYQGIAVQLGNGDGTFQAPVITYTTTTMTQIFDNETPLLAAVADVNKDNFPDAFLIMPTGIVNGTEQHVVKLFIANGDGTFKAPTTLTLLGNYRTYDDVWGVFAFADLNGDGNVDLVVSGSSADGTTPMMAIALGNGNGTFQAARTFTTEGFGYPGSPAIADFDGDGILDLAVQGAMEGTGGYFPGNGDGTFKSIANTDGTISPTEQIVLSGQGGSAAADFDKDGKQDLMFGSVLFLNKAGVVPPVLATTSTAVTSSLNPSMSGASVTFTATVTSATAGTITGSVAFFDGATQLGMGTLTAGVATFSTSSLTVASHSITAQYGGDPNYATSISPILSQVVNGAGKATTSTAVTSSLNPSTSGTSVTFTATVTSATAGTITGTVTFMDGATSLGTGTVGAGGVATLMTSTLTAGSHTITAQYGGDGNNTGSTSTAITQVVNAAGDFSVAAMPSTLTVPAGQTASVMLTVTPVNGSTQTVTLGCSGLPALAACSFMPASITLDGTHAATTQVMISTTAPTAGVRTANVSAPPRLGRMAASFGLGVVGIFGMLLLAPRTAVRRAVLLLAVLTIPVMAFVACSGNPGSSGGGGTPVGSYMISVAATAGTDSHAAPVTLTVN
jgi:Big-like domain-containing protein/VCBS repeat protein